MVRIYHSGSKVRVLYGTLVSLRCFLIRINKVSKPPKPTLARGSWGFVQRSIWVRTEIWNGTENQDEKFLTKIGTSFRKHNSEHVCLAAIEKFEADNAKQIIHWCIFPYSNHLILNFAADHAPNMVDNLTRGIILMQPFPETRQAEHYHRMNCITVWEEEEY